MRSRFRLALAFTTAIGAILPRMPVAGAQVPPPPPPPAAQGQVGGDQGSADQGAPPTRVGQISLVRGSVSFDGSGASQWSAAALNYPVTGGDALYTQPGAEAAIAIGGSRVTLNEATEFQVTSLADQAVAAALSQGEVFLDIRDLAPGSAYAVTTPRGTVNITQNGQYDIVAGDQTAPTTVTVIAGAAQLQGQNVSLDIAAGETATLQGADPVNAALGAGVRDPFVVRLLAVRYAPPPPYVPPVVGQMTGGYQLAQYGNWSQTSQYGAVWYPRVASGWVPYRDGHWAYVAPWGWTWMDNDPWGFAPFHYGRWVQYGGRWGWAPAPVEYAAPAYYQPVYAPATVSFFGVGAGVAIGVGITAAALAAGSIGWVPLGPNEPYLPWYHASPRYVQQVNYYNIRNANRFTYIHNTTIINRYGPDRLINRRGATVIPADAMRRGDAVGRFGRPAPQAILAAGRPVPPAGFRGGPGAVRPGGAARPFGRLPVAPGGLVRRVAAQAPRAAPFAVSRGLPVGRPGPLRPAVIRPQIHVQPRNGGTGAVVHPPLTPRPPVAQYGGHRMPPAMQPMHPGSISRPGVPTPPRPPVAPQVGRPQVPARPAVHPPVQQARPQVHPQAARPAFHPPVQQARPQVHPQAARPAFHPPVQQARPQFHPQAAPRPAFHPPVQQARPAPMRQAPVRQAPVRQAPARPAPARPDQHP